MTTIKTHRKPVNYPIERVFEFLADFNNFESLLPKDRIENWQATADECSFRIKGMADIGMRITDRQSPERILVESHGKVPFSFTLDIGLVALDANSTEAGMVFNGDINPFMKMMVEKPLTNFFNMLVDELTAITL